jgi:hypothetical protein
MFGPFIHLPIAMLTLPFHHLSGCVPGTKFVEAHRRNDFRFAWSERSVQNFPKKISSQRVKCREITPGQSERPLIAVRADSSLHCVPCGAQIADHAPQLWLDKLAEADLADTAYDIQIFQIWDVIAQHLEPESEVLAGLFQLIVAGHDFAAVFNGSMLETSDIVVEIVDRSEVHSAASLNKAAAPNSRQFFFDQRPCVNRREPPKPLRVARHECRENRRPAALRRSVLQGDPSDLTKLKRVGMNAWWRPCSSRSLKPSGFGPGLQERSAAALLGKWPTQRGPSCSDRTAD